MVMQTRADSQLLFMYQLAKASTLDLDGRRRDVFAMTPSFVIMSSRAMKCDAKNGPFGGLTYG
jgi:hypothetical protein